jgi:putative acetyltransferase
MQIEIDDLTRPEVVALLEEHLANMHALSPPEFVHALDISRLKVPEITFWTAWSGGVLMGCGALKALTPRHGEVKSMRTPAARRGHGAARALMAHIVTVARGRRYERLSLETGSHQAFLPAQALYASFGFARCGPFGSYGEDPHSVFMSLRLTE